MNSKLKPTFLSPRTRIDKEMNFNWICIYEAFMNIIIPEVGEVEEEEQ